MEQGIHIDQKALLEAFKSFYIATGIRIVLFDINYNEILSYPIESCPFCKLMLTSSNLSKKCYESNISSFKRCKESQTLTTYACHAGLIEATSPLVDNNGVTRGYIMFGQVSTIDNKQELKEMLNKYLQENGISSNTIDEEKLFKIKRLKSEQIVASSKLLEMCTKYILLEGYIKYEKETFLEKLNNYIQANLKNNLSIEILMDEFHMSRNALYDASKKYLSVGIAEYIKDYKLTYAKKLIKETNYSIKHISEEVGFVDYNYFCRVFKKEVGISAKKYRYQ